MPPPACRRLCDRSDPRAQPGSPLNLAFYRPSELAPLGSARPAARPPCGHHADLASTGQDQIGFRRTGTHATMATGEGRLGGRALPRSVSSSDTFCRLLGELPVGETSTSRCSRTRSELTRGDNASGRAIDAADSHEDRLSPSPATGTAIRCAQGVFRSREFPGKVPVLTRRAGYGPSPPGIGPLSTGCSQAVEKGPAPFSSCVMPCSDGAWACAGAER